jgi:hypothetical protein
MMFNRRTGAAVFGLFALSGASPLNAEVTSASENSFVSRHEVVVAASPKEVWLALISPAEWWRSEHTWSGDSKNLVLTPKAGGCFCETIPEVDEPGRFTLEGSVEHMRVVQAYPEAALRMVGSLGPLQSEPVTGVLTIALTKVDTGTRIVWEYNVGGQMRYEVPTISKAVDGVMGVQLAALAKPLVVVALSAAPPTSSPAPAADGASPAAGPAGAEKAPLVPVMTPVSPRPAAAVTVLKPAAPAAAPVSAQIPAPKSPSVEDAFGEFTDKKPG